MRSIILDKISNHPIITVEEIQNEIKLYREGNIIYEGEKNWKEVSSLIIDMFNKKEIDINKCRLSMEAPIDIYINLEIPTVFLGAERWIEEIEGITIKDIKEEVNNLLSCLKSEKTSEDMMKAFNKYVERGKEGPLAKIFQLPGLLNNIAEALESTKRAELLQEMVGSNTSGEEILLTIPSKRS